VTMFAVGRLLSAVGSRPLRLTQRPTLLDFDQVSHPTTDPSAMAAALGCAEDDFWRYASEFDVTMEKYGVSFPESLHYPDLCRSELNTQRVLYALVRAHRPRVLLEAGVADGFSSFAILSALDANGFGQLHSIDIRSDVGTIVPDQLKSRWTLHILNDQEPERSTKQTLAALAGIDFYYHDSGHSYLWQTFEYAAVAPKMTRGGVFISDDVDWSYAFIDHCQVSQRKPVFMLERRKVIGGYLVPS
jgi:predicted O-methyltransferase YrrM